MITFKIAGIRHDGGERFQLIQGAHFCFFRLRFCCCTHNDLILRAGCFYYNIYYSNNVVVSVCSHAHTHLQLLTTTTTTVRCFTSSCRNEMTDVVCWCGWWCAGRKADYSRLFRMHTKKKYVWLCMDVGFDMIGTLL